ncbi:MAG: hypothetical protein U9R56_02910, partial [candidate division Zixibacteria bacterium]|nr:hypothetical protein [candidate division Zixibacteria bacterium]
MKGIDRKLPGVTIELVVIVCLLALIFLVRVWNLEADPPLGLSASSGVYTDPPQYTLFAEMFVQDGQFNPYHDNRFVFFLKSTVTLLAVAVFKLLGVGLWQSNFVGLLYSFGSLFLFFLFIRKIGGSLAGIFYLILIGLNYNLIFYGRLPFLEHAMFFYASLSLVLLTYFRGRVSYLLAGISLAVGIFFGKVIGLPFLFPFGCFLLYRAFYESRDNQKNKWTGPGLFVAGFAMVVVFWFFFSYLPMRQQVTGYLGEQVIDLYGAPEGLQSADDFIWKMVSFGVESNLFPRMTAVAIPGAVFIGIVLYYAARRKSWRDGFGPLTAGHIFIAAMIIAFFGSLMIWNYRPLRYQLVLIYPFAGAAALILSRLWPIWRTSKIEKAGWLFYPLCLPLSMIVVSQSYSGLMDKLDYEFAYDEKKQMLAVIAAVVTVAIGVGIMLYRQSAVTRVPWAGKAIVVLALFGAVRPGFLDYCYWWQKPTFTLRDNARDLEMILPPEAVLSGPYAAEFTQNNNLGAVIHMFGVSHVDTTLFDRFPVTHLLVDKGHENRARNDYPRMMGGAVHICTYHLGLKKIRLFRVAGRTKNPLADRYERSAFELALDHYNADEVRSANQYALEFVREHPRSISGSLMVAERAEKAARYAEAEVMIKKAVEFSPTNYNLNARMALFYKNRFDVTGDLQYRSKGLKYFD